MDKDEKTYLYEDMIRRTTEYRGISLNQDAQYDKYLATMSTGAFGISFAFIDKIVPLAEAIAKPVLLCSWLAFGICMLIQLLSFRTSQKTYMGYADDAVKKYNARIKGISLAEKKKTGDITGALNIVTFIFFGIGILSLLLFVLINFLK